MVCTQKTIIKVFKNISVFCVLQRAKTLQLLVSCVIYKILLRFSVFSVLSAIVIKQYL